jgi:hypothetical protein
MLPGGGFVKGMKSLIATFGALHARLLANTVSPFIVARRGIPLRALLLILPHLGINGSTAAEELEEECYSLI